MRKQKTAQQKFLYPLIGYPKTQALSSLVVILLIMIVFTYFYIKDPYRMLPGVSDMNFFIHEFGHIIVPPQLPFIFQSVGGTFLQLLFPIVVTVYFFWRKRYLESALFFFWLGTNLSYVGIYMMDTIYRTMPMSQIFGPDAIHDWEYIFRYLNVELQAVEIGSAVLEVAQWIMIGACVYVGWLVVYRSLFYMKNNDRRSNSLN